MQKKHVLLIVTIGLGIVCSLPCFGATYHVTTSGSDTGGDGSLGSPWETITGALERVPDGSTVLVHGGTYRGRIRLKGEFSTGVTFRSEPLYQAKLRNDDRVMTSYDGARNITIEGFDIAHDGPGAGALVVHLDGGGSNRVSGIVLKNNILHDSFNNDILKINNSVRDISVIGNMFYNQTGSDEHIDVNSVSGVTIQDNIFFNDFAGSGRVNDNSTSSYIVIKDSNGDSDSYTGSSNVTVKRNIFLNWQGSTGSNFVLIGEDGNPFHEGTDILVENNLMLGNSDNIMRAPFGVKGGRDITFRHNTISGDLPSYAYGMRINREGANPVNENIELYNNIWVDQQGTMGARSDTDADDFSDTDPDHVGSFTLQSNLYWNGGNSLPYDTRERINYTDDPDGVVADPHLTEPTGITVPRYNEQTKNFEGGFATIRAAFKSLVETYCQLPRNSAAIDKGWLISGSSEDILGRKRPSGQAVDIGACEYQSGGGAGVTHTGMPSLLHLLLGE